MRVERNRGIVNALKTQRIHQYKGHLPCEICKFDFLDSYGLVGAGYIEAHHKESLALSPKGGRVTSVEDFILVCSNCHRILHRMPGDASDVARLRATARRKSVAAKTQNKGK